MALTILSCIVTIWASIVSTLVIHPPARIQPSDSVPISLHNETTDGRMDDSALSLPLDGGILLDHRNDTAPLARLNLTTPPVLTCDEGWGRILTISSCMDAFASIPWLIGHQRVPASFGPREEGHFDVGLPKRWMSCKPVHLSSLPPSSVRDSASPDMVIEQPTGFAVFNRISYRGENLPTWRHTMRTSLLPL